VLGIETATWTASVALIDEVSTLTEQSLPASSSHGAALFPLLEGTFTAADLSLHDVDLIAVSIGPGSFTGLRIGLSLAKGLALGTTIPVIGVPTLEALAFAAGPRPHLIWAVLDARKHEVYAAAFDHSSAGEIDEVAAAVVSTPEHLARRLAPPCTVVGDGVDSYGEIFRSAGCRDINLESTVRVPPSGAAVARLGLSRFRARGADPVRELEPYYVRPSEAERSRITSV
jgi:tRNA threonylcarbamoyladenosine biosynthesis protein TsaB